MAILNLIDDRWVLDYELTPVEYWPYTTYVYDVVMTGPREKFQALQKELVKMFQEAGIRAVEDNKSAFGLKDIDGRMWYFGFKDFRFDLGTRVMPENMHVKVIRKDEPKVLPAPVL